ncbi:MAG: hypothetical protein CMJ18_15385 [Phycisphaeraceae bacterium]|nr:hypothetical protein [Phycisphaeraceae bacterium]
MQHPETEVRFLMKCYRRYRRAWPTRLKEDFCGGAHVAAEWVTMGDEMRALAVDHHGPTLRHAERVHAPLLEAREGDLHLVCADVREITRPQVQVIAALNFSVLIYHDPASMLAYLRAARRSLSPDGVLVLDLFGGPGAMHPGEQTRSCPGDPEIGIEPFDYHWQQRDYDAVSGRIDCRIHFTLADGTRIDRAFRYDWRLWSIAELTELLRTAGFARAEVWCDRYEPGRGRDGVFRPVRRMPACEDWVAYVVGVR